MKQTGGPHLRVLVVDDNEDAADSLSMLLGFEGHSVTAVYSAQAAIEAASSDPDLILLDIGLPSMDGYQVAKLMRAAGVKSALVALTGYGQKGDIERALRAGFDAHVVKPVDFSKLEEIMLNLSASKTRRSREGQ